MITKNYMTNHHLQAFERLKAKQFEIGNTSYKERISKLTKLQIAITTTYKSRIREAMLADFGKPILETDLSDIYPVVDEIKKAKKNLPYWMKNKRVRSPLVLFGSNSYIKYEPKGVCLIMSPWNYPVTLTLCPLVSAIAAGNCVVIKPSEISTMASKVMQDIIEDVFNSDEVVLIQGGVETAEQLLALPFNHIFFTGS
ncbi:aldehyde dehydrogenase family protein, partial [Aegicerativicinus sediminis]